MKKITAQHSKAMQSEAKQCNPFAALFFWGVFSTDYQASKHFLTNTLVFFSCVFAQSHFAYAMNAIIPTDFLTS